MRGVSFKMAAAVFVTVTMLDSLTVEGESNYKPIDFEPIPVSTAEECPISRTHNVQMFTEKERDLLKRIAMAEAGNQGEEGMFLVMSVVVNRTKMDPWPDSIESVLAQPHQFTSIQEPYEYSEECERAFERINSGDIAPQIIAFETIDSDVLDQYFWSAFTYRDHRFYTKN